jgi:hypothetical protein
MMITKWLSTPLSRKFIALVLAALIPILNRALGVDLDVEIVIAIMGVVATWAGIEGAIDYARVRSGQGVDSEKLMTLFKEMFATIDTSVIPPDPSDDKKLS